jgi:translocation and assembly module TamB
VAVGLVAVVLLLAGGLLAALQTGPGRQAVEGLVNTLASGPQGGVRISGLAVSWGLDARLAGIEVSDAAGPYLTVGDVALDWHPIALLGGRADIERLTVGRVDLARLPQPDETARKDGGGVPLLPFRLAEARVDTIAVGAAVAGAAMQLTARADARLDAEPRAAIANLSVSRTDGTPGEVDARIRFAPDANQLAFDVTVSEPRGGLAARLLRIEGLPALGLTLKGDGPLDDWSADLALSLDGRTEIAGAARLIREGGGAPVLRAELGGELGALAPPIAAALVMGRTELTATARFDDAFAPREVEGRLTTATVRSDFAAKLGPDLSRIEAGASLHLSAGQGAMIGLELPDRLVGVGESTLELRADGTTDALDLMLRLSTASLGTTEGRLQGLRLQLTAENVDTRAGDVALPFALTLEADRLVPLLAGGEPLAGPLSLSAGGTAHAAGGRIELDRSRLALSGIEAGLTGSLAADQIDTAFTLAVADLARFEPRASGALTVDGTARGPSAAPQIEATARAPRLMLAGKPVTDLEIALDATTARDALAASLRASGSIDGNALDGAIDVRPDGKGLAAPTVTLKAGENRLSGSFAVADLADALGTLSGRLAIEAPKLAEFSALALTELGGALNGDLAIERGADGTPAARLTLEGADIAVAGARIAQLSARGRSSGPLTAPQLSGDADLTGIVTGDTSIQKLTVQAASQGTATNLSLDARLSDGRNADGVALEARLEPTDAGLVVGLATLDGRYGGLATRLAEPARVIVADGGATIDRLALRLGEGRLDVSGSASGERLALDAKIASVPLSLANAFASGIGLAGAGSGTVTLRGTPAAPEADWAITLSDLSAAALRNNGLAAVAVKSTGQLRGNRITQTTDITGADGLAIRAQGPVALAAPGALDIDISGQVPLSAARQKLILSGFSGSGALAVSGKVTGAFAAPRYTIGLRPQGMSVTQLSSGLTLRDFSGSIGIDNSGIAIEQLRAAIAAGGTLAVQGRIGLDGGMPADISVRVDDGRYSDGRIVQAQLGADLRLNGPLSDAGRGARLSGTVAIARADITIPSSLPGAIDPVSVTHVHAPDAVRRQEAALARDGGGGGGGGSRPISLDVTVSAPGRIFVRGRGLDAEMGGTLRLVGTTADPQAIGSFSMRRGFMQVLTRRVTFSKGDVGFTGSLMPRLDFAATSQASNATITITVTGEAQKPDIAFTSSPQLPQDEVLAQFLFDRSMSQLSPAQIAQLGASVLALTGGSGEGPLGALRKSLGVDAIDVETGGTDGPSLAVGKYLSDNIYLGVKQGARGDSSRVTVDIDVTRSLKLRGEVGANGESKAGIFFEREFGK